MLFGNLAPGGAVLKRSAADPRLFERDGRCVVFTSLEDLAARIDDPQLDVTPDAASGGPLALVQSGDRIRLSVRERRLDLLIEESELARRRSHLANPPPTSSSARGYSWLYDNFITQANEGCDFAFLKRNGPSPQESRESRSDVRIAG